METIVNIALTIISIYLVLGFFFAVTFITRGITKTDEAAKGSGWGFRIIILPGVVALWPLLLKKWLKIYKQKQQ